MTAQTAIDIACQMLELREGELDNELIERIQTVHELITRVVPGGDLHSTQVVAMIVEQYYREKGRSIDENL